MHSWSSGIKTAKDSYFRHGRRWLLHVFAREGKSLCRKTCHCFDVEIIFFSWLKLLCTFELCKGLICPTILTIRINSFILISCMSIQWLGEIVSVNHLPVPGSWILHYVCNQLYIAYNGEGKNVFRTGWLSWGLILCLTWQLMLLLHGEITNLLKKKGAWWTSCLDNLPEALNCECHPYAGFISLSCLFGFTNCVHVLVLSDRKKKKKKSLLRLNWKGLWEMGLLR